MALGYSQKICIRGIKHGIYLTDPQRQSSRGADLSRRYICSEEGLIFFKPILEPNPSFPRRIKVYGCGDSEMSIDRLGARVNDLQQGLFLVFNYTLLDTLFIGIG